MYSAPWPGNPHRAVKFLSVSHRQHTTRLSTIMIMSWVPFRSANLDELIDDLTLKTLTEEKDVARSLGPIGIGQIDRNRTSTYLRQVFGITVRQR